MLNFNDKQETTKKNSYTYISFLSENFYMKKINKTMNLSFKLICKQKTISNTRNIISYFCGEVIDAADKSVRK